jgi:nicotinamide-nucleotide adenylyltransferase
MSAAKVGLYIGKFQPFHNGHVFAIKQILAEVDKLTVVIGSSQYHGLKNQPFSATQRRQMIERTLLAEGIKNYSIIEVPDIHDSEHWVDHVKRHVRHFDFVFTNNDVVQNLFTEQAINVRSFKMLSGVSGTLIRQKLTLRHNDDWQSLVPVAAAEIIQQIMKHPGGYPDRDPARDLNESARPPQ